MPGFISDTPLAHDLIRIGDEAIAREDDAALRAYFAEDYVFHGPGSELGFDELSAYFASLRAAFSDLQLVREQILADGSFLAARTTFSGDFTGVFTYSPIGPIEPTGAHLEWELIGIFRYDGDGRLAEEWVQTDYRSFLTKLGVTTTESAERGEEELTGVDFYWLAGGLARDGVGCSISAMRSSRALATREQRDALLLTGKRHGCARRLPAPADRATVGGQRLLFTGGQSEEPTASCP